MEYSIEPRRALKSSFLSEPVVENSQHVLLNDIICMAGVNNGSANGVNSDDFSVDDLLDLSDKEFDEAEEEETESDNNDSSGSLNFSAGAGDFDGDFGGIPAGEPPVPVDDMENLEWLSQFVEDSMPTELSLLCPAGSFKPKTTKFFTNRSEPIARPVVQRFTVLGLLSPVPRKPRSTRSKKSQGVWPIGSLSLTESSSSSSSSQDSSSTSPFTNTAQLMDSWPFGQRPAKKQKRNPTWESGTDSSGPQVQRRCSHCQVQKTPQWRTGPLGPKTLCNACGVRYKSGRLFPEYRPACSPTFSSAVHSNSHRKVIEMRRKKEVVDMANPGLIPVQEMVEMGKTVVNPVLGMVEVATPGMYPVLRAF